MFFGGWASGRREALLAEPSGSVTVSESVSSSNEIRRVSSRKDNQKAALTSPPRSGTQINNNRGKRERDESVNSTGSSTGNGNANGKGKPSSTWGIGSTKKRRRRLACNASDFKHSFLVRTLGKEVLMPSHDGENSQLQYEIIELDELAFPRFRMEWREDNVCPFCSFNATSRDRLIKHFHRFHGDHHAFKVTEEEEDGAIKIQARPTKAYREQCKSEMDKPFPTEPELKYEEFQFVRFRTSGRERKRERIEPWVAEGWVPKRGDDFRDPWTVPVEFRDNLSKQVSSNGRRDRVRHQYYHSRSRIPMRVGDWEVDSDDASDSEWIDQLARGGLHEFLDVKEKEKLVLGLWSQYMRSDAFVSDKNYAGKVKAFMKQHAQEFKNYRQELLMLLTMFSEHRLISPSDIEDCMEFFHHISGTCIQGKSSSTRLQSATGDGVSHENGRKIKRAQNEID